MVHLHSMDRMDDKPGRVFCRHHARSQAHAFLRAACIVFFQCSRRVSKRKAQTLIAAATRVTTMYQGSVASAGSASMAR
jgi:hypothetical protein